MGIVESIVAALVVVLAEMAVRFMITQRWPALALAVR
jgi:hypothetical protein